MNKNRGGRITVKKRVTFTVDEDVYEGLQQIPRGVSVSEIVSWLLKALIEDLKKGRELTQEEFDKWLEGTQEGMDFRDRFIKKYGHLFKRLKYAFNESGKIKKAVKVKN
jgi:hypothetical protein